MTPFQRRAFIAVDEWLGALALCWIWHVHREVFWPAFIWWAFCVYVISYPAHWGWWSWLWRQRESR